MKGILASFGFIVIRELPSWTLPKKEQKHGNYLSLKKSIKKHIKYVKPKIKTYPMSQDYMLMIFLQRGNTQKQPSILAKLLATFKKYS